jgi:hypothetical protein
MWYAFFLAVLRASPAEDLKLVAIPAEDLSKLLF